MGDIGPQTFADVVGEHILGESVLNHLRTRTSVLASYFGHLDRVLLAPPPELCGGRTREQLYLEAFEEACAASPPAEPPSMILYNLLAGAKLPPWTRVARGPVPLLGGRGSVCQVQQVQSAGRSICLGASVRVVTDLGEDCVHSVLIGGPSDRPWSRWYASDVEAWVRGVYKRLEP